jgi:protein TonB
MRNYIPAFFIAGAVTFFLLWGMQALLAMGEGVASEAPKGRVLDFVRVKQESVTEVKKRKPKKPPKPQEPPPPMEQPQLAQANPNATTQQMSFDTDISADIGLKGGLSLDSGDGEYLPIVKVAPIYPRRAQSRGIEGYVIVEFVVAKNGSVKNPVVVEAQPEGIFEKAALEAASKFKYKARVVDGEPVAVAGVQNKITFKLGG